MFGQTNGHAACTSDLGRARRNHEKRKELYYLIQTKKGNQAQCYKILIFFSYNDTFLVAYLSRC